MQLLYSIVVWYIRGLLAILPLSGKIKQFVNGREHIWNDIKKIPQMRSVVWMHCASLGEYEQGLPLLKSLREKDPDCFYLLTFFSPSGFKVNQTHQVADLTTYLPWDSQTDVRRFIKIVQPTKVLFIKSEFWPNMLVELQRQSIPTYLIAGLFQSHQVFFKPWGRWFRKLLRGYTHIFVQNNDSQERLHKIGISQTSVSGDPRFDRVQHQKHDLSFLKTFIGERKCIVAGSTWPQDIAVLKGVIQQTPKDWCWLIAPHEIDTSKLSALMKQLPPSTLQYTSYKAHKPTQAAVLVLDTIGLLSSCYQYGQIAYVGGALGRTGLHNILEPAAAGIPIVIGRNYRSFPEAVELVKKGGVISIGSTTEAREHLKDLIQDKAKRDKIGSINLGYISSKTGATKRIIRQLLSDSTHLE